jgi:hypothetical protein
MVVAAALLLKPPSAGISSGRRPSDEVRSQPSQDEWSSLTLVPAQDNDIRREGVGPLEGVVGQRWTAGRIYSITRSACSNTEGGIAIPRMRAVLRLTTSSNFVGCSTGKSAGFAPLRILST